MADKLPVASPSPRHTVAVAALVTDPSSGNVLLIRSPRRGWECPGGQVEEGESLTDALVREVREETGVEVAIGPLAGVHSNLRSRIVAFDFRCEWTGGGELTVSAESLEVEWVTPAEAVARVTRPPQRDRLRDLLRFDGTVVYRAYEFTAIGSRGEVVADTGDLVDDYVIREERRI